jgi:hypothetical protein
LLFFGNSEEESGGGMIAGGDSVNIRLARAARGLPLTLAAVRALLGPAVIYLAVLWPSRFAAE